jgi:hypothetical protein
MGYYTKREKPRFLTPRLASKPLLGIARGLSFARAKQHITNDFPCLFSMKLVGKEDDERKNI